MITEDYVSYETAKLLKEKGFNEATNRYYNAQYDQIRTVSDTFMWQWNDEEFMKKVLMDGSIAIPTLQMTMKWLREVHKLYINIWADPKDVENNDFDIVFRTQVFNSTSNYGTYEFSTYEEACEAAIRYCLENLI